METASGSSLRSSPQESEILEAGRLKLNLVLHRELFTLNKDGARIPSEIVEYAPKEFGCEPRDDLKTYSM